MSSTPDEYLDDIMRITQAYLNQLEELKAKRIHGVRKIDGQYDQHIEMDTTGNVIIQCDNGCYVGIQEDSA